MYDWCIENISSYNCKFIKKQNEINVSYT